ncbi:MAG: hypothetical protein AMXMBFR84_21210 [Candidatus Hydrogenedentota bacterium]
MAGYDVYGVLFDHHAGHNRLCDAGRRTVVIVDQVPGMWVSEFAGCVEVHEMRPAVIGQHAVRVWIPAANREV